LYSNTLERFRIVLQQHKPELQPEVLPTMQLLVLYEVCDSTFISGLVFISRTPIHLTNQSPTIQIYEFGTESSTGWLTHTTGIETVLQLGGPRRYVHGLDFQVFQFYRTIGVWISISCVSDKLC
jgi:hypothetical protein